MTDLTSPPTNLPEIPVDQNILRLYRSASKADETKRALLKNWRQFEIWCNAHRLSALPATPDTVEAYLVYLAESHPVMGRSGKVIGQGLKSASICQALWAINARHRMGSFSPPGETILVQTALAGIKRRKGSRKKQQAPLTIDHIRSIQFTDSLKSVRDKAVLLLGFAGCFRRSELVGLQVEDIAKSDLGLQIYLERSKTDQQGAGVWVDILTAVKIPELCPVAALQDWLAATGIKKGPIFRSLTKGATPTIGKSLSAVSVDAIVKWAAVECGLDVNLYGGHSLRAGKATYLSEKGISPTVIAKHGRWKSMDMVLTYCRGETANALKGVY